ncbi:MAG: enoyl-CoA hydratase/isomerase family protein [Pseudomonadota bacterium]
MIDLEKDGEIYILTMNDDENRWNTTFVREFSKALDEAEASEGPAALITRSANEKFFSNGLDLEWISYEGEHRGGDRVVFGEEFMALMGRIITFPMPTIAAINGHAFGAGFMCSLCHDIRMMRVDRGFVCANEMQIGMQIPVPELALFKHKIPMNAFFETVQLAKRWAGPAALDAGIVQQTAPLEELMDTAMQRAKELAPLATKRENYRGQKENIYGENSALNQPHGAAHMLKNSAQYRH